MSGRTSSAARGSDRLAARRRLRRRRAAIALVILSLILCAGVVYGLNQSVVRIARVQIFGADQSLSAVVLSAMQGKYLGIVPRDSIFFYPAGRIRADILATDSHIAAVSLFRNGLTGLSVRVDGRAAIAKWCGLAPTEGVNEYCYVFDASGLIYAAASASSTPTINSFSLYAPLEGSTEEPLRATIAQADKLPATFDFARSLNSFGTTVTKIVIHDGEVDEYLTSGTRVRYVLGSEQNAFTALVSARDSFNLADGSIEYVDLRFDGKVYLKRNQ